MNDDRSTTVAQVHPADLAASTGDAVLGTTLHDTYKVVRFLAEGGMGRVYEAQHTRIATKRFAIKVLHAELKHSLEVRMRFRREAEAAASIDHPNVVGVHDFGYADDGAPYLVCDYLEGRELGMLIESGQPLSIPLSTSIARQLCRALEAAHEKGVIHRDLKPANVFLVGSPQEPEVRVLDFGLSRIVELAEASVTQTGIVMGTPSYMSPEQARGERADHRVDVYGVGAVLYACLTGRPPYEEDSPHATVLAVMSREAARPCSIVPSIPPELEVIVQTAMARDPNERYATMRDLDGALDRFEDTFATRRLSRAMVSSRPPAPLTSGATDANEARGIRRRAVGWLVLAGVLMLVGTLSAALGMFTIISPNRPLLPTELLLVSVAVIGSLFTPGVLFMRWLRRSYWGNSARMVNLVAAVRGPVLAGASVYGLAVLLGRMLDTTGAHLMARAPAPNASGWLGWSPFLFGLGVLAAMGALTRHRLLVQSNSLVRRILAGPFVIGLVTAGCVALLMVGYRMSDGSAGSGLTLPVATAEEPAPQQRGVPVAAAGSQAATTPVASQKPADDKPRTLAADQAPADELEAAIQAGVPALSALRNRFPKDPSVLKPLAIALGKEAGRASELLRVLDALFTEAPEEATDAELGKLVHGAALSHTTSQRAIDLMRSRMGLRGAEMLFDLVIAQPEIRPRARAALDTSEVQAILSPALKIAYDVYSAPTCTARVQLLPQAVRDGDERAINALTMFTLKTLKGCGPRRNKPCPPLCVKEIPAFEQAIKQIKARLAEPKPEL